MDKEPDSTKTIILDTLAEYLGAEPEDIKLDDSLVEDLQMRPTDISDFLSLLEKKGVDTSNIDLSDTNTVTDIIDQLE